MVNGTSQDQRNRSDAGDDFSKKKMQNKIGQDLRKMYDDVLNEPVPDDFLSLLSQADERTAQSK